MPFLSPIIDNLLSIPKTTLMNTADALLASMSYIDSHWSSKALDCWTPPTTMHMNLRLFSFFADKKCNCTPVVSSLRCQRTEFSRSYTCLSCRTCAQSFRWTAGHWSSTSHWTNKVLLIELLANCNIENLTSTILLKLYENIICVFIF